jgi:hypothetical protein
MTKKVLIVLTLFSTFPFWGKSQTTQLGQRLNAITTGVPFLMIAPDSRAGAMGDAGVATSPDPNSVHWNPAKYAFIDQNFVLNVSYIPWLRNLVGDINFSNISGAKRIDKRQAFGFSIMYFSLGNIAFTSVTGDHVKDFRPYEVSADGAYALKLSDHLSGGIALRYIYSNLTGGYAQDGAEPTKPGKAVAGDISTYYTNKVHIGTKDADLGFGINVSNLGTKISYGDAATQEFLPANLRFGSSLKFDLDEFNSMMFTLDFNKLLVPTPPLYSATGDTILKGKDPNVSVPTGVFQSFNDAPGGMTEELHEFTYSIGMEYWYNKQFALRAGYFHEHPTKGNRKYVTLGLGLKLNVFSLDFAYLVPTEGRQNPLANTLRFTLGFNFGGMKDKDKAKDKKK